MCGLVDLYMYLQTIPHDFCHLLNMELFGMFMFPKVLLDPVRYCRQTYARTRLFLYIQTYVFVLLSMSLPVNYEVGYVLQSFLKDAILNYKFYISANAVEKKTSTLEFNGERILLFVRCVG